MPRISIMPDTAYARTVATVRDYPRMCKKLQEERNGIIKAMNIDGMPKGTEKRSFVEDKAIRIAELESTIEKIKGCVERIPSDMRSGILNNIYYKTPYPYIPSKGTWVNEKRKFLARVAKELDII